MDKEGTLRQLEECGSIRIRPGEARGVRVVGAEWRYGGRKGFGGEEDEEDG